MNSVLKVSNIHKSFDKTNVIKGISFTMNEGERICLLGSSGSGKSTLLQIIGGLLDAEQGEIMMEGRKVMDRKVFIPPEKRPVNMVFQDYALWPHMTVRQNIEYGLKRNKVPTSIRNERIRSATTLLQLDGLQGRLPSELSGGQQQRGGIARALATEPSILLMDEPLSNLDVKLRTEMRSELAYILKKLEITTIYVTHDVMEAFALADRILVLENGKVAQLATPQTLYEEPATIGVAQLMGYQNQLTRNIIKLEDNLATVQVSGHEIKGLLRNTSAESLGVGDKVSLLLQSEAITIDSGKIRTTDNKLVVNVVQEIYEGSRWRYRLELQDGQYLEAFYIKQLPLGKKQEISFPLTKTRIFN